MPESPGRVVMLVGTSSAGKTSTATALQGCFDEHHLLVGFDVFLRMVDPRWAGHGPYTRQGLRYDPSTVDSSGEVIPTISCGPSLRTPVECAADIAEAITLSDRPRDPCTRRRPDA